MIKVGTDIVEIDRIKKFIDENIDNLERVFSKIEIDYSFPKRMKYQHFAARFAGKEAVIKALNDKTLNLRDIEIQNDENGKPFVRILNNEKYENLQNKIAISLSHSLKYAVAFVILDM
jgi:holo-[acyl-carrier protein] synthase